jgi:cyanophycin synthetase
LTFDFWNSTSLGRFVHIIDSRRLIGPNLQMARAGAVAEISFEPGELAERDAAVALWRDEVTRLASAVELEVSDLHARSCQGGAALSFAAPLDRLLAASDLNDLAIARATDRLAGKIPGPIDDTLVLLRSSLAAQANPRLLELEREAIARDLPLLLDDNSLTLGMGASSRTWELSSLPAALDVDFRDLARIPTALITGTNGKTTSARLLAHLVTQDGKRVGLAATDFVSIAGEITERGDFTGPAAARMVLRDPRVEIAVLETARGGILRRGLAFDRADCALITNIADDHLGEYGIDSVEALARAKGVVARAVRPGGKIALNLDDAASVALFSTAPELFPAPIIWCSLHALDGSGRGPERSRLRAHLGAGGEAMLVEQGKLVRHVGGVRDELIDAAAMPISFQGAASFNVANALGAAALAFALGVSREAIVRGLSTFRPDGKDNPGRVNLLEGPRGIRVLVDFGHNAPGVHQIGGLVANLRAARPGALTTLAACAGDRSDDNLRALAHELYAMGPRKILLRDLDDYLRGRQPGEVPAKLTALLRMLGMPTISIETLPSETASLQRALDDAQENELILLLVHLEEDAVRALLEARGFQPA